MGPTSDDIFNLFYISAWFGRLFIIANIAVWLWDIIKYLWKKWKDRRYRKADELAAKRKAAWAAEIERAGIKMMNDTDYFIKPKQKDKPKPIRKVCGVFSVEGQKFIEK